MICGHLKLYPNSTTLTDVTPDSRTAIKKVFGDIGFQLIRDAAEHLSFDDPASGVAIRIEFDDAEPVYSAVKNPAHFQIFDTDTRVITPEYLMWMLCESGLLKHRANAVDLYLAGHVDVAKLSHLLERAGRADLLAKVREIMASAERVKFSSYDASMVARMARMKRE